MKALIVGLVLVFVGCATAPHDDPLAGAVSYVGGAVGLGLVAGAGLTYAAAVPAPRRARIDADANAYALVFAGVTLLGVSTALWADGLSDDETARRAAVVRRLQ